LDRPDRHLVRKGLTWYFSLAVPRPLQQRVGRRLISRSLGTTDPRVARERRDQLLPLYRTWFASLTGSETWDPMSVATELKTMVAVGEIDQGDAEGRLLRFVEQHAGWADVPGRLDGADGAAAVAALDALQGTPSGVTLGNAIEQHLEHVERTRAASTTANRRWALTDLEQFLGAHVPLAAVTRRDIGRWCESLLQRDGRRSTARLKHRLAAAFFRWALAAGLIEQDPTARTSALLRDGAQGVEPSRRGWTDLEVAEVLPMLPEDHQALMRLGLYSGLRIGEIVRVRGRDLADELFRVRAGKTASARRVVPVHSQLRDLVKGLGAGDSLVPARWVDRPDRASKSFGQHIRRLGMPEVLTYHSTRHSFAERLERAGVARESIEALLGHSRTGLAFSTYSRGPGVEVLKQAVEKVEYTGL
jgi:integrase